MQANLGLGLELFASAGGFSNYFSAADYQQAAVNHYFDAHDPGYPYYISNGNNIGVGGEFTIALVEVTPTFQQTVHSSVPTPMA